VIPTFSHASSSITQGFQQPSDDANATSLMSIVDMKTFEAYAEFRTAKLLFLTNTSYKTDYLVLERLNNESGKFDELEHRNVISGNDDLLQYPFNDKNPQNDDNFYRIKQVSLQGDISYTDVRKLTFGKSELVSIFPNPASEYLMLDLAPFIGKDATISIFSEVGQKMHEQKVENIDKNFVKISLDDMDSGNYQIQIAVKGKRNVAKQFVITK
jgi:hypothetical protein